MTETNKFDDAADNNDVEVQAEEMNIDSASGESLAAATAAATTACSSSGSGEVDVESVDDSTTTITAINSTAVAATITTDNNIQDTKITNTNTTTNSNNIDEHGDAQKPEAKPTTLPKTKSELVGEHVVIHPFGKGVVLEYRDTDGMYVIKLSSETSYQGVGVLYSQKPPVIAEDNGECDDKNQENAVDDLNVALEKLETMRRLNLEVECHERGIFDIDYQMCTCCLKERGGSSTDRSHFPRLQKFMDSTSEIDAVQQSFQRLNSFFGSASGGITTAASTTNTITSLADQASSGLCSGGADASNPSTPLEETQTTNISAATDVSPPAQNETTPVQPRTSAGGTASRTLTPVSVPAPAHAQAPAPAPTFPRLNKLWGTIQTLPQPVKSSNTPTATAVTAGIGRGSQVTTTAASTAASESDNGQHSTLTSSDAVPSASSFPRIRGLLKSTKESSSSLFGSISMPSAGTTTATTTGIFGGASNSANNSGASAVASILMQNASSTSTSLSNSSQTSTSPKSNVSSINGKPKALPRIQKLMDQRERANTAPCLICASPSCPKHSSASFRREGIPLCLSCERLFELDFIVDCVNQDPSERSKSIDHMIDCYDRCVLMLRYSARFVEPIAKSLEEQKEQQNKIGLASSSVGMLSGVLGIAAAASILTPAGPPLLIASLFFGGGATTVQTGSEAMNYFSEPRKVADRVIALHGMALSLLRVTSTLRDAMLCDHVRTDVYEAEPAPLSEQVNEKIQKNRVAVLAGTNFGRTLTLGGVAGAEAGAGAAAGAAVVTVAGAEGTAAAGAAAGAGAARSATAFSRAGTAAARTVRFARFAGGALSAAVLVMEANAIQSTLKSINEGNPCDKADTLRRVVEEVEDFPATSALDGECRAYLEAMESRPVPPAATEVVAVAALNDHTESNIDIPEATCQPAAINASQQLCAPGAMILEGDGAVVDETGTSRVIPSAEAVVAEPSTNSLSSSSALFSSVSLSFIGGDTGVGGSSLFQRFQTRQELRQDGRALARDEVMATVAESNPNTASAANRNAELHLML
jgi:hypothetical protein